MRALFELNPSLDRAALAARIAQDRRVQIRDVLITYVPPFSQVGRFAITGWFRNR